MPKKYRFCPRLPCYQGFYNFFCDHISVSHRCTLCFVQLSDLYNNDSIFDKFECCVSRNGFHFATGSYRYAFWLKNLISQTVMGVLDYHLNVTVLVTVFSDIWLSNLLRIFSSGAGNAEGITIEATKNDNRFPLCLSFLSLLQNSFFQHYACDFMEDEK